MQDKDMDGTLNRRELLGRGSALAFGLMMGGSAALHAEPLDPPATTKEADAIPATPVNCAVIGLGDQGRTMLTALHYVPGANIKYVCDTYIAAHKRALETAPQATAVEDYRKILDDKTVQAIWVVTPSHQHKQIVLDAIQAGKHIYCEAPLASQVDEAKAIAVAAKGAKQVFHTGLQQRTNPQHNHVLKFIRTGALARIAQSRAQWHKKTSWRRAAPNDARQADLNWRLRRATSGGLIGEIGIHQMDVATWFMKVRPVSVSGFGGTLAWNDGRDVPDTVQCIVEYPENVHFSYDATLANSFDSAYELFQGTDAAILVRDGRAWMFKEADAPSLGWEVYAYKEKVGEETGIALVADATKLLAAGKEPGKNRETDPTRGSLYYACDHFLNAVRAGKETVCGPEAGYEATVVALKANEAVLTGSKITLTQAMFDL